MKYLAVLLALFLFFIGSTLARADLATQIAPHTGMTVVSRDVAYSIFNWFDTRALRTVDVYNHEYLFWDKNFARIGRYWDASLPVKFLEVGTGGNIHQTETERYAVGSMRARTIRNKVFYYTYIELEPEDEHTLNSPFRLSGVSGRIEPRPPLYRYGYRSYPFGYRHGPRFLPRFGSFRNHNIVPVSNEMLVYELDYIAPTVALWPNDSTNEFYWPSSQNESWSWYYGDPNPPLTNEPWFYGDPDVIYGTSVISSGSDPNPPCAWYYNNQQNCSSPPPPPSPLFQMG